jgi:tetratricopeptide (TPR) repeat protein
MKATKHIAPMTLKQQNKNTTKVLKNNGTLTTFITKPMPSISWASIRKLQKNMEAFGLAKSPEQKSMSAYNLGNSFYQSKDYSKAIDAYKQALRNNPTDLDSKANLTKALTMQQQQNQQNKDKNKQNQEEQDKQDKNSENKNKIRPKTIKTATSQATTGRLPDKSPINNLNPAN